MSACGQHAARLFVGLGNPGAGCARNRHNIGWMALDEIARTFGPWRAKFHGSMAEGRLDGKKVFLFKPLSFMNRSGQPVAQAMRYYRLEPCSVTVFHDELDLPPGSCRVKIGGGHAGHNGLRSLDAHIGPEYARVRLGIGHPGDKAGVSAWVLRDFAKSDDAWLVPLIRRIGEEVGKLAAGDLDGFRDAVASKG